MLARKTSKNQLTLPKEIVSNFPDIDLFDATIEENRIVLTPMKVIPLTASLAGVRSKIQKLGLTPEVVNEAVEWSRK